MTVSVSVEDVESYTSRCRAWYEGLLAAAGQFVEHERNPWEKRKPTAGYRFNAPAEEQYRREHPFPRFFPEL